MIMVRRLLHCIIAAFLALPLLLYGCHKQEPVLLEERPTPLTFLFFSDTQADPEIGDYSALGELLAQAVKVGRKPTLAIFGGDTVNVGGDADEWQEFWQAAETPLAGLTTAVVAGNHDSHTLLAEQFDYPRQAPSGQGEGFFYSFDFAPVHFIMLDSNIMGAAKQKDVKWLRDDLQSEATRQAIWRIAVMHHPMWPVVENPKDAARAATMREHFLPLLEAGGVDLILCGHQHVFALSLPMRGAAASDDGSGIIQIMAASGAKESYVVGNRGYVVLINPGPNYLLLTADDTEISIAAYDEHGEDWDISVIAR